MAISRKRVAILNLQGWKVLLARKREVRFSERM